MAGALVPDALWNLIEPLLPIPAPKPQGGRPRLTDRACLAGIIFVLRSGIPWRMLPQRLGCGSGMSCWRRLRHWQQDGIWDSIHFVCWIGFPVMATSTGHVRWSIAVRCEQFLGAADWAKSHR
jgi:transposase